MNTEQMIDQLNDIHNGLAKMDLSSGAYQYFSEKLIRVKKALAKNLPQAAVSPNEGQQLSNKNLPEVALPSEDDLKLIIESNDITRSFYQIIARRGKETNWEAIEKRVEEILGKQYKRIYQRGNGG